MDALRLQRIDGIDEDLYDEVYGLTDALDPRVDSLLAGIRSRARADGVGLVLVDDAHRVDAASCEVLRTLAHGIERRCWSYSPRAPPRWRTTRT